MAFYSAATTTTLGQFIADVRVRANALSEQASRVHRMAMVGIVHDAVTSVRTLAGKAVDEFYETRPSDIGVTGTLTTSDGKIALYDLSDVNTASIRGIQAFHPIDSTSIPIYDPAEFDNIRAAYSGTTDLRQARFGRILNSLLGSDNKLTLQVFNGLDLTSGYNVSITYPRNPVKRTANSEKLDLPETLVPITKDFAITALFRKMGNQPPLEEDGRVRAYINSTIQRFGYELSEKK